MTVFISKSHSHTFSPSSHPEYPERTLTPSEIEGEVEAEGSVLSRPKVVSKVISKGQVVVNENSISVLKSKKLLTMT